MVVFQPVGLTVAAKRKNAATPQEDCRRRTGKERTPAIWPTAEVAEKTRSATRIAGAASLSWERIPYRITFRFGMMLTRAETGVERNAAAMANAMTPCGKVKSMTRIEKPFFAISSFRVKSLLPIAASV